MQINDIVIFVWMGRVEDEQQFLMRCSMYNDLRQASFDKCQVTRVIPKVLSFDPFPSKKVQNKHVMGWVNISRVCILNFMNLSQKLNIHDKLD